MLQIINDFVFIAIVALIISGLTIVIPRLIHCLTQPDKSDEGKDAK